MYRGNNVIFEKNLDFYFVNIFLPKTILNSGKECPCPNGGACHETDEPPEGALDEIAVTCVECAPGSGGARCEKCLNNYFGDPLGRHGSARPCNECNCNGNINKLMPDNCDAISGRCSRCLFNTYGEHCEKCVEGFYGDPGAPAHEQAHGNKGCVPCECSKKGSESDVCAPHSGQCACLPGVGGKACDACKEQHFALTEGIGCQACDCDPIGKFIQFYFTIIKTINIYFKNVIN